MVSALYRISLVIVEADGLSTSSRPLSEARLIRLGLAADRARVIHHLMYLVGSRPISETGKIGLHGVSRSARFPGFNV